MFNTTNGCRYKYILQLDRKTKIALLVIFSLLALASTQLVNALTSDWKLTVHVVRVPFGASYIHIHVKGPFGATRNDTIKNSQNTTDAFNMTRHDFPTGYRYEVCITAPLVERTILPNCTLFYHGSGDEAVTVSG